MFRGNYPTRADEKGRLKVPADFKRYIEERYSAQFYVTSLDGKSAMVYPMEEWERMEQKIAALPSFNPTRKKFLDRTNYYGQVVDMDAQGRMLLPGLLREAANLKGELAVVGHADHLVVRNMDEYRNEIAQNPWTEADDQTLSELGI
jgi:MraZ protein